MIHRALKVGDRPRYMGDKNIYVKCSTSHSDFYCMFCFDDSIDWLKLNILSYIAITVFLKMGIFAQ